MAWADLLGGQAHRQQGVEQAVTQDEDHQTGQGENNPRECHDASPRG